MNKVVLMGHLARDPEIRYSQSAEPIAVARYAIAVSRRFKKEGEPEADFINCVVFGKSAEFAERYFKKGMRIAISGSLRTSSWDDKQTGQKRYGVEVIVDEQEFAESKASFENRRSSQPMNQGNQNKSSFNSFDDADDFGMNIDQSIDDSDLPF